MCNEIGIALISVGSTLVGVVVGAFLPEFINLRKEIKKGRLLRKALLTKISMVAAHLNVLKNKEHVIQYFQTGSDKLTPLGSEMKNFANEIRDYDIDIYNYLYGLGTYLDVISDEFKSTKNGFSDLKVDGLVVSIKNEPQFIGPLIRILYNKGNKEIRNTLNKEPFNKYIPTDKEEKKKIGFID
jgi:hypothetical protein